MSITRYFVKNRSQTMGCYNLSGKDGKGGRLSVILARNDVSRALTEEEFQSPEIQKGLQARKLLDVTQQNA